MITLSIITPTCGRESLEDVGRSILNQGLVPDDEWIVVADGPQPVSKQIITDLLQSMKPGVGPTILYFETAPTGCWGNFQRDVGISVAGGTHVLFTDDDDQPQNLQDVISVLSRDPESPHLFKADHVREKTDTVVHSFTGRPIKLGNVCTPMIVLPNNKRLIPRWEKFGTKFYMFFFIQEALFHLPEPKIHDTCISKVAKFKNV